MSRARVFFGGSRGQKYRVTCFSILEAPDLFVLAQGNPFFGDYKEHLYVLYIYKYIDIFASMFFFC